MNLREGMVWMEQTRGWHQRPYLARMILKEVMETVRRVVMVMLMVIWVVEGVVVVGVVDVVVVDVVVVDGVVVGLVVAGKAKIDSLLGVVAGIVLVNGVGKNMKMVAGTGIMRVEGVLAVMIAAGLLLVTGGVYMVVATVVVSGLAEVVAVTAGVVQLEVPEVAVEGGVELLTAASHRHRVSKATPAIASLLLCTQPLPVKPFSGVSKQRINSV